MRRDQGRGGGGGITKRGHEAVGSVRGGLAINYDSEASEMLQNLRSRDLFFSVFPAACLFSLNSDLAPFLSQISPSDFCELGSGRVRGSVVHKEGGTKAGKEERGVEGSGRVVA